MEKTRFVSSLGTLAAVSLLWATPACTRKQPELAKPKAPVATAAAAVTPDAEESNKLDPNDPKHGTRKLVNLDAPVYVDGVQLAVLRYGDLAIAPNGIMPGGSPNFSLNAYLKSIGIALESVKAVHFHGNQDRIGSVEGAELVKEPKRFLFSFTSGLTGAPVQRWDGSGLKNEFVFHEMRKISVFVKKPAPPIHPQRRCHLDAKGECTDAIPYASGEAIKGTRVYVDGKMAGGVKRRLVTDDMILGKTAEGDNKYSVAKLVAGFGVNLNGAKAVEIVSGDSVIARATSEQWAKNAPTLFFTLPKHQHGKVQIHVPAEVQSVEGAQERDALVSSVVVYKATKPTNRELTPISEDTDIAVQLAAASDDGEGLGQVER